MAVSLIVIFFIACMVWMWSHQGLFSAVIHLLLTIISGMLALALWEPFVYGFLIYRMPEQAWGMGLLIPFALILLVLRTAFDKLVVGNLSFHNLVDKIGGGAVGFVTGVLTAGLMVIGLQMVGMPSLFGFQAYTFDTATGQVERKDSLIIPADTIAARFFTSLGSGALRPMLGDRPLGKYHPDLARQASFFHQSAFWEQGHDSSMRAISPRNLNMAEEHYSHLAELPPSLRDELKEHDPHRQRIIVVGTEVLKVAEGAPPANDAGAGNIIRFTRPQVGLAIRHRDNGRTELAHAVGYIQAGQYATLLTPGAYAYTGAADRETFHWVFQIPADWEPMHLMLKHTRFELPEKANKNDTSLVERLITGGNRRIVDVDQTPDTDVDQDPRQMATLSEYLPWPYNRNDVSNLSLQYAEGNRLIAGEGMARRDTRGAGEPLLVSRIYHEGNVRIVRVDLGNRRRSNTILGKSLDQAAYLLAPELHTASGKKYLAMGFAVVEGAQYRFKILPDRPIRAFQELEPARLSEESNMYLYFAVDVGETVTKFQLGNSQRHSYSLNLQVPAK